MLWKKLNSPPPSTILKEFKNQEYEFTIPKSQTRLVEKREVEKEKHRWLATGYVFYANAITRLFLYQIQIEYERKRF